MFFERFSELCKSVGKTPTGVGLEIGISKTTISYWRNTDNVIPKQDVILKISEYFNVSVDYLLGKTEQKNSSSINGEANIEKITVYAMDGTPGAVTRELNLDTIETLNELFNSVRDLPKEKIEALISAAKAMK